MYLVFFFFLCRWMNGWVSGWIGDVNSVSVYTRIFACMSGLIWCGSIRMVCVHICIPCKLIFYLHLFRYVWDFTFSLLITGCHICKMFMFISNVLNWKYYIHCSLTLITIIIPVVEIMTGAVVKCKVRLKICYVIFEFIFASESLNVSLRKRKGK